MLRRRGVGSGGSWLRRGVGTGVLSGSLLLLVMAGKVDRHLHWKSWRVGTGRSAISLGKDLINSQ